MPWAYYFGMGTERQGRRQERTRPDLTGVRHGKLVITGPPEMRTRSDGRQRAHYPVRCDCGKTKFVLLPNLTSGQTTSCGCVHREQLRARRLRHGGKGTRLYRIWLAMHYRCNRPAASNYKWYGGKGVRVCRAWSDFAVFQEWALGHGYQEDLTIDRKDPAGNYTPTNCEWVTRAENARRAQLLRKISR